MARNVQAALARGSAFNKLSRSVKGTDIGYAKRRQALIDENARVAAAQVKTPDIDKYQAKSKVPKAKQGTFASRVIKGRRSANVDDQRAASMLSQLPAEMKGKASSEGVEAMHGSLRTIAKKRIPPVPASKPSKK